MSGRLRPNASDHDPRHEIDAATIEDVARRAATDAGGVAPDLLGDFLPALVAAVAGGRAIPASGLRAYRSLGTRAAREGVALRVLLDLYLSAAWRLWPHLPAVLAADSRPGGVVDAGQVMLHAADDVVAVLTEAYQLSRRALIRAQESARREFIDDLLGGSADVVGVLHRAGGLGLDLAAPHAVLTVRAERDFDDGLPLVAAVERAVRGSKGDADALVASKDGHLVVVFAAPDRAAIALVTERLTATLRTSHGRSSPGAWQVGIGRAGPGADTVVRSYRESLEALHLAERLSWTDPVVDVRDLLVYRVLLNDRSALHDLVESTLAPLRSARGGAAPLLATLSAYLDTGGNAAAASRALHLSVRAVTYRLDRIRELIGLDPDRGADRLNVHVAVLGARLLEWT